MDLELTHCSGDSGRLGGFPGIFILFFVDGTGILLLLFLHSLKFGEHLPRFVDFSELGINTAELVLCRAHTGIVFYSLLELLSGGYELLRGYQEFPKFEM